MKKGEVVVSVPRYISINYDRREMKTADTHLFFLLLTERLRVLFRELSEDVTGLKADLPVRQKLHRLFSEFREICSSYERLCRAPKDLVKREELETKRNELRISKFLKAVEIWKYLMHHFDLAVLRTKTLFSEFGTFYKMIPAPQMFLAGVESLKAVTPAVVNGEYVPSTVVAPFRFRYKFNALEEEAKEITVQFFKNEWLRVENFKMQPEKASLIVGKVKRLKREIVVYPFTVDENFAATVSIVRDSALANVNLGVYRRISCETGKLFYLMLVTRDAAGKPFVSFEEIEEVFEDRAYRLYRRIEESLSFLLEQGVLDDYEKTGEGYLFKLNREKSRGENPIVLSLVKNHLKL
jgi:hypothetical protein